MSGANYVALPGAPMSPLVSPYASVGVKDTRFASVDNFRDPVWAILFLVHAVVMIVIAVQHGQGLESQVVSIFQVSENTTFWVRPCFFSSFLLRTVLSTHYR